jgi:uncharacterized protein DUF3859
MSWKATPSDPASWLVRTRWIALGVALFALFALPAARAQTAAVAQAEILWAGLYRASIIGTVAQPNTAIGRTNQLGQIDKLESTTTVPVRLGINFGFEYRLLGAPEGATADVKVVVTLPKAGLLNPARQERVYRESWEPAPALIGGTSVIGYLLEQDWELVPGLWKFELWHGDHKLGEQSFCLIEEGANGPSEENRKAQEQACHSAATA